jgi:hypothetical protein
MIGLANASPIRSQALDAPYRKDRYLAFRLRKLVNIRLRG